MADTPAPPIDAAAIHALVEEVVRRITASGAVPVSVPKGIPAAAPAVITLPDAVITLAHVDRLPAGTRDVVVTARAVITPSARDRAREAGFAFRRGAAAGAVTAGATHPFVIAQADCRGTAAERAAAVARGIPGAQRLPTTGLADAVASLATHASRDGARGVLLTSRVAAALILANRSSSLRAVTARDAATLAAAAADCVANLLVLDPTVFVGSLERACAHVASRPASPVPPELSHAPPGCNCTTHGAKKP